MCEDFRSAFCSNKGNNNNNDSIDINGDELSLINSLTNRFILEVCTVPKRLYCPFCLFDFAFDFLLRNHIQEVHLNEIKNFAQVNLELFTFDLCLFCHAKFYTQNVLPKHVIRKHPGHIINYVSKDKTDGYIYCKFCPYKILLKQNKLLFIHLENKHLKLFEQLLLDLNVEFNKVKQLSIDENEKLHLLDGCMKKLTLSANSVKLQGILCERKIDNIKPILKRSESNISNSNVRRQLRFELPNISSSSSEFDDKENYEPIKRNSRFNMSFGMGRNSIFRRSKLMVGTPNKITPEDIQQPLINNSTPVYLKENFKIEKGIDTLHKLPFRCGLCIEGFTNNGLLVRHVKRVHRGFKLKARYRCGECKAKFYKNSYLLKHYYCHHNK